MAVGGEWVSLGRYDFQRGDAGYVSLSDGGIPEGAAVLADAVKFLR